VTTGDGLGRPPSDLHDDASTTIDRGADLSELGMSGNGGPRYGARPDQGPRGNHASMKASTAYEVAAALRAQASRAAQATREAGRRVQDALSTQPDPGALVANNVVKPADTPTAAAAVVAAASAPPTQRRHAPDRTGTPSVAAGVPPVGAAAALAATAPTTPSRPRETPPPAAVSPTIDPAAAPSSADRDVEAGSGYSLETHAPSTAAYPAEEYGGSSTAYSADPAVGVPAQNALIDVSEPASVEDVAAAPGDAIVPEAAALAPVVAPVIVPTTERGVVESIETQVSVDARPDATQLAPPPVPKPAAPVRRSGRVRKARLRLMRVDPWSVMKTAFLLSVALGVTLFVAVAVLWSVLDAAGVFTAVGNLVRDLTSSETNAGFQLENYTALSRVLGFTTLIAVVDVVLVTALATLGAFLYNLSASLLGGLEVTLAEDE
jgi:hypothetical protein